MIYLGADHRGFQLKEALKRYFTDTGIVFEDVLFGDFVYRLEIRRRL